ncbi:MAG: CDP-alcohol phosphatidyltransferase family protein [Pirellulaceae bacterium]|jgi:CDP-diacylglycerol--glycerol-3-phosphate 3-phosphatidyltransferase|nr:CDP-alcohol phosphatidyltransferase family protein [Pirellulaceae bacterium]MDP6718205.1 CDP-alcohol phosphatidyltransferase family protein [Pirellulaceae bacterium]
MTARSLNRETTVSDEQHSVSRLNVPNLLCAMRLAGSPVLVGLAIGNQPEIFVALLVFLLLTDWLDGKLAILWKQRTTFGARLDSVADLTMYSALLFGAVWLKWEVVRGESAWLIAAVATHAVSTGFSYAKFRRLPSYHTRSAKTCWLLTSIGAISLFSGWSVWPLRIASAAVAFTNLEAIAITTVLPKWRTDITSIYHACRDTRNTRQRPAT